MNTNDRLKMMLMGAGKGKKACKDHGKEEKKEGKKSNAREESLEDSKGQPISVRVREGKQPFPFQKRK